MSVWDFCGVMQQRSRLAKAACSCSFTHSVSRCCCYRVGIFIAVITERTETMAVQGLCVNRNSSRMELSSHQETDGSVHLNKSSKCHHMCPKSQFELHSPTALYHCFWKQHSHMLCSHCNGTLTSCLPKEACLYMDADWLSSSDRVWHEVYWLFLID